MMQENTSEIFTQLLQRVPAELKRIENEDAKMPPNVSSLDKVLTVFDTTVPWDDQLDNLVRHSAQCVKAFGSYHAGRQTHYTWVSTGSNRTGVFNIYLINKLD